MCSLFLSSYLPLFALVGARSVGKSTCIALVCAALVLAGAVGTLLFFRTAHRKPLGRYELLDVQKRDGDVAAYAATYLLPFVTVFSDNLRDVLTLAAFIAFLGIIYVRSRLIYVNPLLALFGYHLWQVIAITAGAEQRDGQPRWPRYLLTRRSNIYSKQKVSAYRILDDLLLDKADKSG